MRQPVTKRASALFRFGVGIVRSLTFMRRWPYILVVDDDADFRTGLRMALEILNLKVTSKKNE